MKQQLKNKLRAIVLLTVFSLSTLAGFACSVGIDLGYNTKHHEHGNVSEAKTSAHIHGHHTTHAHTHFTDAKITGAFDDCCGNQVNDFALLTKSVAQNYLLLKAPGVLVLAPAPFFIGASIPGNPTVSRYPIFQRWRSPDDTDIRIAIQSFQI